MKRLIWLFLGGVLCAGTLPLQAQEIDQRFMAVFVQGKRVGYYRALRKAFPDSIVTTEFMTFSVDAGEGTIEKLSVDETVETRDGQLIHFRHETSKGPRYFRLAGQRDGLMLTVALASDGQKQENLINWPEGARMVEGRRILAIENGLKKGTSYQFLQFFGDNLAVGEVTVSVLGEVEVDILGEKMILTETLEVIVLEDKKLEYTVYRDASATPMKIIAPTMFMELINCSQAYAMTPLGGAED
ncbi:MAG: hypothetical protein HN521_13475 [Candidatus Latescibacteria bacterium]|jgi:hypothetical protein|nr:hypothetical protein [Candidatus Latescibacterota bacterium]MBT5831627.1 hypothetical protein [Candidatus Latescibacterota bacterium]